MRPGSTAARLGWRVAKGERRGMGVRGEAWWRHGGGGCGLPVGVSSKDARQCGHSISIRSRQQQLATTSSQHSAPLGGGPQGRRPQEQVVRLPHPDVVFCGTGRRYGQVAHQLADEAPWKSRVHARAERWQLQTAGWQGSMPRPRALQRPALIVCQRSCRPPTRDGVQVFLGPLLEAVGAV